MADSAVADSAAAVEMEEEKGAPEEGRELVLEPSRKSG